MSSDRSAPIALLDGAFTVFVRRGYAQACVKEITQEAGVAKPTVYSHLDDQETL
ncbi:helix-turn-helix transcriptional regulator [Streptomyces sp. R302]|uniref:TetR/AcrR family transcriptional regulator n=1 Tax=unclassified Streptomyces TaxID=2593676 RepID=UPI00145F2017|nr:MULTISPECIES: helix-turn-helix domain-containing protein [unclassified Streptomyces]NML51688.1 helix-turn-helix transcriptional regulator [Streptomyces sp. R301]NML81308.1 helix-turn-helix transcriptional regulator [Streptomyces sp. R302]